MKLNPIATNMTELEYDDGRLILFSYKTPVACRTKDFKFYQTAEHYSPTTTKHITKWLTQFSRSRHCVESMPANYFNAIAGDQY